MIKLKSIFLRMHLVRDRPQVIAGLPPLGGKKKANPDMKPPEIKKISQQELTRARAAVGAKRETIKID